MLLRTLAFQLQVCQLVSTLGRPAGIHAQNYLRTLTQNDPLLACLDPASGRNTPGVIICIPLRPILGHAAPPIVRRSDRSVGGGLRSQHGTGTADTYLGGRTNAHTHTRTHAHTHPHTHMCIRTVVLRLRLHDSLSQPEHIHECPRTQARVRAHTHAHARAHRHAHRLT